VVLALGVGCAADTSEKGGEDLAELAANGKADTWRAPTEHGDLNFSLESRAALTDTTLFHAWEFELSGSADVSVSTTSSDRNLDTVLYMYRLDPESGNWGRYIARNDDHEGSVFSRLDESLETGRYRVMVKGFKEFLRGRFAVVSSCDGRGCVATDPGAGVDYTLPSSGPFTEACLNRMNTALLSPLYTQDEYGIEWRERANLGEVERKAAEYFYVLAGEYEDIDEDDYGFSVRMLRTEDGTIVEIDPGSDWSYEFLFDGAGDLITYHFNDQSPWSEFYCAADGSTPIDEPEEFCAGAFLNYLPHDQDYELEYSETWTEGAPNDEVTSAMEAAIRRYITAESLDSATVEVRLHGKSWEPESGWGADGAEITLSADGASDRTYLLGGDYVLTETGPDGSRVVCEES